MSSGSTWFQRIILPGFAFKAVVIGGGYATGRELVEFFLASGPVGGLLGMAVTAAIWSGVCVMTFLIAYKIHSRDYTSFFRALLGRFGHLFELSYIFVLMLMLSVFGAAAGEIGKSLFGWPLIYGTLALMAGITLFAAFGNDSVERLFKYVSLFLYAVYAALIVLALSRFGGRIGSHLTGSAPLTQWLGGGITYASYNIIGAAIILPVTRHIRSSKDAVAAGLLAGPLAITPAVLFFLCIIAFYPEIGNEALPSAFILDRIGIMPFTMLFQSMIFLALLESGTGAVHAVVERLAKAHSADGTHSLPVAVRAMVVLALLGISIFVAERFGLVTLIAHGYRMLAWLMIAIFLLPLMIMGPRLVTRSNAH